MTTSIRRGKTNVGLSPRSAVAIASNYLRIKFHEKTGGTAAWEMQVDGTVTTGAVTLAGTTTNVWNNSGWITPADGAGNGTIISENPWDTMVDGTLYPSGSLVILGRFYNAVNPLAARGIFEFGDSTATPGGYELRTTGNPNENLQFNVKTSGGGAISVQKVITSLIGTPVTFMAAIDAPNSLLSIAINGDWADSTDTATDGTMPGLRRGSGGTLMATALLCDQTTGNPPTIASQMNSGATELSQLSDLIVLGFSTDWSANFATLFAQYHANPLELPLVLNGA